MSNTATFETPFGTIYIPLVLIPKHPNLPLEENQKIQSKVVKLLKDFFNQFEMAPPSFVLELCDQKTEQDVSSYSIYGIHAASNETVLNICISCKSNSPLYTESTLAAILLWDNASSSYISSNAPYL